MWVNLNAHCASCVPPQVILGRASEASSVEFTQKQCIRDFAVSTACKPIVLNELLYII